MILLHAFLLAATLGAGATMPVTGAAVRSDGAAIQGTVRAEQSLEPVAHATVTIRKLGRAVLTDRDGYFVLTGIPAGRWRVEATALGYRANGIVIVSEGRGTVRLDFELAREPIELSPVEAQSRSQGDAGDPIEAAGPPALHVSGLTLKRVPGIAEPDVLRALQTLPAVAASSDFSSALYVRGGSPDQTLITLDGVPLFNPYHLGGVFAAIDPDAVAAVDASVGALPARAGDRISGIVDIRTRDGGRDRARATGAVGLISSRVGLDGPLPGGKGSYLLSLRRTYLDLFTDAAYGLGLVNFTVPYAFTDAHLKLTRDVGALGRLSASVYVDREGFSFPKRMTEENGSDPRFAWGSFAASVALRQPLGADLVGEFRVGMSNFTGRFGLSEHRYDCSPCQSGVEWPSHYEQVFDARTTTRDVLARADFTWYHTAHEARAGLALDAYLFHHHMDFEDGQADDLLHPFRTDSRPTTLAAYLTDEWTATPRLALRGGLRVLTAGERGTALLPRVGARFALASGLDLTLGAGRYAQVVHTLRNEESMTASIVAYDALGAVSPAGGLVTGEDVVAGAEWRPSDATSVRLDAYAKRMHHLPLALPAVDAVDAEALAVGDLRPGEGSARGLELLARHRAGSTELSLSYALSFAERELDGVRFVPRFERRHMLDLNATTPLGKRGELSARLALGSGQPYTPAVGLGEPLVYDPATGGFTRRPTYGFGSSDRTVLLGTPNTARLPGYFRLDLAARKSYRKHWFGHDGTLTPYVQILNVLGTPNVLAARPAQYRDPPRLDYMPQLPFLPTFGIEWRF